MALKFSVRDRSLATLIAIAACLFTVSVYAAESSNDSSGGASSGKVHPVAEAKKAGKEIGHGVKKSTKIIGHGFRDGTRAVGHKTREVTKEIGHGTKKATKEVGHAVRDGVHEVGGKND